MIIDATFEEQGEIQAKFGVITKTGGKDAELLEALANRLYILEGAFEEHKTAYENAVNVLDKEYYSLVSGKQDKLTFDEEPTAGSENIVKSGGIYAYFGYFSMIRDEYLSMQLQSFSRDMASTYASKQEVGDIASALAELHSYAEALKGGAAQ